MPDEYIYKKHIGLKDINIIELNLEEIKKEVQDIMDVVLDKELESLLTKELLNNEYLFKDEENNINYNNNLFSLHELKDESVNAFEKIFINFFLKEETKLKAHNNIFKKEKEKISRKFSYIKNKITLSESIINSLNEENQSFSINESNKQFNIISHAQSIKDGINEIKKGIVEINENISEYYDLLILSVAVKIKLKVLEEKIQKDKIVLSFEQLFKEWKMEFDESHIKELKKKYLIDEKLKYIQFKSKKDKNAKNVEYLKTSQLYRAFISNNELLRMDSESMIHNIDKLVNGHNFDIYGEDEEINYSGLNELNEEQYLGNN